MLLKLLFFGLLLSVTTSALHAQNSLELYISSAKQNSPLINENQNLSRTNQLEIERLKAQFTKPQVGLTGNVLFAPILATDNNTIRPELNSKGADKYYGYELGATNGGQYQGLVTITQPILNQERYKTFAEQANISSRINQNNIKLAGHDIEKFVTDQYILCLLDLQQSNYATDMMNLLLGQREIVKKLATSSLVKQSDFSLINIEYKNFETLLATNKANYRRDLMDLNILAGIGDTALVQLDTLVLTLRNNYASVTSQYEDRFRLDSLNLDASQKVFETRYKPQVNLFANSGLNAVSFSNIPRRFGVGAGVSVVWNFYDGKQKEITQRKTKYLMESIASYRGNFLIQNDVRKNKFITELNSYQERSALLQEQLNDYRQVLNSYKKEILFGQQSIINFTNIIKSMALVQRDYLLLQTNRLLLINAYNYWNW